MFLFKKTLAPLLFPLPFCLLILAVGLFLLWFTRRQRAGKVVMTLGMVFLALFSFKFPAESLLRPLEYAYPPLLNGGAAQISAHTPNEPVRWIVVLGGGYAPDPNLPVASQISSDSLTRVVEGIRLYRAHPGSKLLFSGGGADRNPFTVADVMARTALMLGIPRQEMALETESRDTKDQARRLKPMLGTDPFILVTSASHMRRSVALFEKQGLHPMPAPTDHWVRKSRSIGIGSFYPGAHNLAKSTRAVYEYLGLVWAWLRGQV